MLIFDRSAEGRSNHAQQVGEQQPLSGIDAGMQRKKPLQLPEVSELQSVRHYTQLSQKNFSIDTHFYPLGSCTMKYNPRGSNTLAMQSGFLSRHPAGNPQMGQGVLASLYELQEILRDVTGMGGDLADTSCGCAGRVCRGCDDSCLPRCAWG